MSESLAQALATTVLYGGNADFIEDLYQRYLKDWGSVDPAWARYFEGLKAGSATEADHRQIRELLSAKMQAPAVAGGHSANPVAEAASAKQAAVSRLIQVYAN